MEKFMALEPAITQMVACIADNGIIASHCAPYTVMTNKSAVTNSPTVNGTTSKDTICTG